MGNGRVYFAGPPYNADSRRACLDDDASRDPDEDFDVTGVNRLRNRYQAFGGAAWIGRGDCTIGLYETCGTTGDREFCPWLCDYCTGDCDRCSGKWMCGLSGCCKLHFDAMDAKCGSAGVSTQLISSARAGGEWLVSTFYFRDYSDWIVRDRSGAFVVISACLAAGLGIVHYFLKGGFRMRPATRI